MAPRISTTRSLGFLIGMICLLISQISSASSTPRLNLITPRGVQRGNEHTLKFSGERLNDTQQIFVYDPGVEVLNIKQIDNKNVEVKIRVANNCRLGEHIAQVRTARGISDYRSFYVGAMQDISEAEPNNSLQESQIVQWNRTINGTINSEDVDVFQINGKMGQRLSVEIEAIRLGYMFDPFISILNEQNFEIAISDDSHLGKQDGILSIKLPEDGNYYILVREASYGGNGNCRYRLHIGNFPRPTISYPAGGPAGQDMELRLIGDAEPTITKNLAIQEASGLRSGVLYSDSDGFTPSPIHFRVSDLPNHLEVEPNQDRKQIAGPANAAPCAFNGIIETVGDHDYFSFSARKGENFDVNCFARRIGSGLDPVINVFSANGKHIIGDDDARRPDCYLRFNAPENGDYFIRVRDHLNRGQEDFVYRVEIAKVQPSLSISIPRVDRYSQLRQKICVPQGNRFATLISANRNNFGGSLELLDADWPEGVSVDFKPMAANLNLMPVVFSAAEDASLTGKLVDLKARHVDAAKNIVGTFNLRADFSLGPPNNALYFHSDVNRLACAVTQKVPFQIEIVQPQVPLVRNGSMMVKIVAHREKGFEEPINVQFPFRPPGLGTKPQIQIPKGKNEAYYPLNANGGAQIGKWPVYAIGQSNVGGPVWVSTQLAELEITEPYVTMEIPRTSCHQGETTTVFCKLNHHAPFDGEAKAELLGIPPNIEIPELKFNKETKELSFEVKTNEKSRIGKHKGLFCRVTINKNGEPIVSTAARSEIQINKPKPKPSTNAGIKKPKQKNVAKKPKPKSRLQQLRDAAKASSGK